MNTILTNINERIARILKKLEEDNKVEINDLCQEFGVSEVTIRKDLQTLADQKLITRVRGGAIAIPSMASIDKPIISNIQSRQLVKQKEKETIGKLAASLIADNDIIILDAGTTTLELAKNLDKFSNLTIITNSINIALELTTRYKRFNVIMIGGQINKDSLSLVGPVAISTLKKFYCDKLFLGVDSFNIENGLSTLSLEGAAINQAMISIAKKTIAVFDSSKINKRGFTNIAPVTAIDTVVTDKNIPEDIKRHLIEIGIKLFIVDPNK